MTTSPDHDNNLVAAGALWADLTAAGLDVEPVIVDGVFTNQLEYGWTFLASRYRLTVERVPDTEDVRSAGEAVS